MSCLALRKDNKRCRSYARLVEEDGQQVRLHTCKQHANFFEDVSQIKQLLFNDRLAAYMEYDAIRHCLEEWFTEGLISFHEMNFRHPLFRLLGPRSGQAFGYFVSTVALYNPAGFQPSWNKPLWKAVVSWLWTKKFAYGPYIVTDERMAAMICVKGDMGLFYEACGLCENREMDGAAWFRFFDHILRLKKGAWADEWLHTPVPAVPGNPIFQTDEFRGWKERMLGEWKIQRRARIADIKEELMAVTWHPDRFMDWCLDWEEATDLKNNWRIDGCL